MIKISTKSKKAISDELKRFLPLINNLQARGKSSSEDDARILINDILSYVLGYDKYNELRTEFKEKNGRLDYVVKLTDGPNKTKKDKFDFVIEAKAIHVELNQHHIDQTLTYCLTNGIEYFVLTNVAKWELYKVKRSKTKPEATQIFEVNLSGNNNVDALSEDFYIFSKTSYMNGDWEEQLKYMSATKIDDVVAILLSDKVLKLVSKELSSLSGIKLTADSIKDLVENQIVRGEVKNYNKKLLSKLNEKKKTNEDMNEETNVVQLNVATNTEIPLNIIENEISAEVVMEEKKAC